jgi:hypothetical protein
MAAAPCFLCQRPIGYERALNQEERGIAHTDCLWDEEERGEAPYQRGTQRQQT